jgi:SAM-dependent methyltransferase
MAGLAYKFSHNWFQNLTAKLWTEFLLPRKAGIARYLEVGVAEGQSLVWVLNNLLADKPDGHAVGIDPFLDSRNWHEGEGASHKAMAINNVSVALGELPTGQEEYDGGRCDAIYWLPAQRPTVNLLVEPSQSCLMSPAITDQKPFDLAYVDGNHDGQNALLDIVLCYELLRDGGILVIDDYERAMRGGRPQVLPAVNAFEETYHGLFDPIYYHYKQVAFVKRTKRRRRRDYPPMLVAVPCIIPDGETGE